MSVAGGWRDPCGRRAERNVDLDDRETELPVVTSLSWASDGSYLAVGNESGNVEIWDVDTAKRMRNMTGHLVSDFGM